MIADRKCRDRRRPRRDEAPAVAERDALRHLLHGHDSGLQSHRRLELRARVDGVRGRHAVEREARARAVEPRVGMVEDAGGVRDVNRSRRYPGPRQRRDARPHGLDLAGRLRGARILGGGEIRERAGHRQAAGSEKEGSERADRLRPEPYAAHSRVELQLDGQRRFEPPRSPGEGARLIEVVKRGNEPVRPVDPDVGGVREVENQDLAADSRAAKRHSLLGHRDGEPVGPLRHEAASHRRRAVPVSVGLDDAVERAVAAEAVGDPPVVARDRPEIDRGEGRPHETRRMSERRCGRKPEAIRTARARGPRSSRRSCGRRGTRAGSRRSARFAASRR